MNSRGRSTPIWPPTRNETRDAPDLAHRAPDQLGDGVHGRRLVDPVDGRALLRGGFLAVDAFGEQIDDVLGRRQIAGGRDRDGVAALAAEEMQLAEGRDVVEPRIGAGVGDHDHAVGHQYPATIGHPIRSRAQAIPPARAPIRASRPT